MDRLRLSHYTWSLSNLQLALKKMKIRTLLNSIVIAAALLVSGCGLFPEASFDLSSQSRLTGWYALPAGTPRSDINVQMNYYVKSSGRTSVFRITNLKTNESVKFRGTQRGLQPIKHKQTSTSRPMYEVITVDGITEVIEHRKMEPIFYITDDPTILKELGVTSANKSPNLTGAGNSPSN